MADKSTLTARVALVGGQEVKKEFAELGKAGEDAFKQLSDAQKAAGEKGAFDKSTAGAEGFLGGLQRLGGAAGQFVSDFSDVAAVSAGVYGKIVELGALLGGVSLAFVGLGMAGGKAATDMQRAANDAGIAVEAYQKLSQAATKAGADGSAVIDAISKVGDASQNVADKIGGGLSEQLLPLGKFAEGVTASLAGGVATVKLYGRELAGTEKAAALLGVRLTDSSGKARDQIAVFFELARAIASIKDPSLQAQAAGDLFGKAAASGLLPTLRQGLAAVKALEAGYKAAVPTITAADQANAAAQQKSLGLLQGAIQNYRLQLQLAATPIATAGQNALLALIASNRAAIEDFTNGALRAAIPLVSDFLNALSGKREAVNSKWVLDFVDGVKQLGATVRQVITGVVVAEFRVLMGVAKAAAGAINGVFGTNFSAEGLLAAAAIVRFTGALSPLAQIALAGLSAVRLIGAAFGLIAGEGGLAAGVLARIGQGFAALFAAAGGARLAGIFAPIIAGASSFLALIPALIGWPALVAAAGLAAGASLVVFWDQISAGAAAAFAAVTSAAAAAWASIASTGVGQALGQLWSGIAAAASAAWSAIAAAASQTIGGTIVGILFSALKSAAVDAFNAVAAAASTAFASLAAIDLGAVLGPAWESVKAGAAAAFEAVRSTLAGGFAALAGSGLGQALDGVWQQIRAGGAAAWAGIADAAAQMWASLVSAAEAAVSSVLSTLARINAVIVAAAQALAGLVSQTGGGSGGNGGGGGKGYASGGLITGPGTGTSDSILVQVGRGLARFSNGEYVIPAQRVRELGVPWLDALRAGRLPKFAAGGLLSLGGAAGGGLAGLAGYGLRLPALSFDVPRFVDGGLLSAAAAAAPAASSGRSFDVVWNGQRFSNLSGPADTVDALERAALRQQLTRTTKRGPGSR